MSRDRFIEWGPPLEWGAPTLEKLATVARDFLGPHWTVRATDDTWLVCECEDKQTFALRSCRDDLITEGKNAGRSYGELFHEDMQTRTRGFEVFFSVKGGETSVITRQADEFTSALADRFAEIIARWWNGKVKDL